MNTNFTSVKFWLQLQKHRLNKYSHNLNAGSRVKNKYCISIQAVSNQFSMEDSQYLERMFEDLHNTVRYYPNNRAWSMEQSKYLKRKILAGIRRAFATLDSSQASEAEVTSTSVESTAAYYSLECSCARTCIVLSPRPEHPQRNPFNNLSGRSPHPNFLENNSYLRNRDMVQDGIRRSLSALRIPVSMVDEENYREDFVDNLLTEDGVLEDDESSGNLEVLQSELNENLQRSHENLMTEGEVEDDESSDNSEVLLSKLNETINNLQSFRNSMRNSATAFKSEIEELKEITLPNADTWIIRKKFGGVPVVEKRQEMIEVLLNPNYNVCFNAINIKLPSSYQQLVETVYPTVNQSKKKVLTGYFAGSVTGNSFFKELMNTLADLHDKFCEENDCQLQG